MKSKRKKSTTKERSPMEAFRDIKGAKRQRLITERKQRGLTQGELAALLGCSVATVSHLETGRVKPNLEISLGLETLFGLPFEILFPDL